MPRRTFREKQYDDKNGEQDVEEVVERVEEVGERSTMSSSGVEKVF
jgi:hypothetical protein